MEEDGNSTMGNIQNGENDGECWGEPPGLRPSDKVYMLRLLWRRGLRHRDRLLEGYDIAVQELALLLVPLRGVLPGHPVARRVLLDAAVYLAVKELASCGLQAVDIELLPAVVESHSALADDGARAAVQARGEALAQAINRLPAGRRAVTKLKLAGVYFPWWEAGEIWWDRDEEAYVLSKHDGLTISEVMKKFHALVQAAKHRQRQRVPSTAIAWLLGRGSSDAVDSAFYTINKQLKEAAPPGAALISNANANTHANAHAADRWRDRDLRRRLPRSFAQTALSTIRLAA